MPRCLTTATRLVEHELEIEAQTPALRSELKQLFNRRPSIEATTINLIRFNRAVSSEGDTARVELLLFVCTFQRTRRELKASDKVVWS